MPIRFSGKLSVAAETGLIEYICAEKEKDRSHIVVTDANIVSVASEILLKYAGNYEVVPLDGRTAPHLWHGDSLPHHRIQFFARIQLGQQLLRPQSASQPNAEERGQRRAQQYKRTGLRNSC
jgi:hypothetical protein